MTAACSNLEQAVRDDRAQVQINASARVGSAWPEPGHEPALLARYFGPDATEPLTDAVAVEVALLRNQRLAATLTRLGIARTELARAGLLRNPRLVLAATSFSGGTEFGISLLQPLLDLFHRPLREALAGAALDAARAEVTEQIVRVAFAVRRAMVDLRAAQALLAAHRRAIEAADSARLLMEELHGAGNVIDARLTEQEIVEARARLDTAEAELAVLEARATIDTLLDLSGPQTQWRADQELEEPALDKLDLAGCEARALAASLELQRNRAHATAAAQVAKISDWQAWFDGLTLGAAARRENEDGWGFGPVLELPLPIFDRGDTRATAAALELQALGHEHRALGSEVRAAARRLRDRVHTAVERQRFVAEVMAPLHERLLRETIREYNGMQLGAFAVFRSKLEQLEVAREAVTARAQGWRARLDIEQLFAGAVPADRSDADRIATQR